jgi:phenylacetate-coenzyme A ligase PaaK-like adenylate-forming protein
MLNFSFEDCRKVLESFDTSDSQIYIKTVAGKDLLTVNVESATASKELESKIKSALLENMGKLKERVQQQALSFEVNLLNVGSIPRDKRSGKVKQVIDERI